MKLLYICYAFVIVTGATMINYRQADGWNNTGSSTGSGARLGSGTFGSSHK